MVNSSVLSIERAHELGIIITGSKEFIYDYCVRCLHHSFSVALGSNKKYGWYIQTCDLDYCSPLYDTQLKLF